MENPTKTHCLQLGDKQGPNFKTRRVSGQESRSTTKAHRTAFSTLRAAQCLQILPRQPSPASWRWCNMVYVEVTVMISLWILIKSRSNLRRCAARPGGDFHWGFQWWVVQLEGGGRCGRKLRLKNVRLEFNTHPPSPQ